MQRRKFELRALPAGSAREFDERFQAATPLRRLLNKVFPDHWSFLLGEIALYSFIVLLLSGVFLALFFDPSMQEVKYNGSYAPLQGIGMSRASGSKRAWTSFGLGSSERSVHPTSSTSARIRTAIPPQAPSGPPTFSFIY